MLPQLAYCTSLTQVLTRRWSENANASYAHMNFLQPVVNRCARQNRRRSRISLRREIAICLEQSDCKGRDGQSEKS
jgi:acyl carrier protein phosphodiesterase